MPMVQFHVPNIDRWQVARDVLDSFGKSGWSPDHKEMFTDKQLEAMATIICVIVEKALKDALQQVCFQIPTAEDVHKLFLDKLMGNESKE